MLRLSRELNLATLLLLAACASAPQNAPPLDGTSWQLVKFQGGDGKTLVPDDKSKYTLEFGGNGILRARIDCNRGSGSWSSSAPGQVRAGVFAITRASCGPGSLYDQIVRQLGHVRSYTVKDGNLYLSLMADGGVYELEPIPAAPR